MRICFCFFCSFTLFHCRLDRPFFITHLTRFRLSPGHIQIAATFTLTRIEQEPSVVMNSPASHLSTVPLLNKTKKIVFLIKHCETKFEEVLINQSALMQLGFVVKEQRCDGYAGLASVCEC